MDEYVEGSHLTHLTHKNMASNPLGLGQVWRRTADSFALGKPISSLGLQSLSQCHGQTTSWMYSVIMSSTTQIHRDSLSSIYSAVCVRADWELPDLLENIYHEERRVRMHASGNLGKGADVCAEIARRSLEFSNLITLF
jgi:hypothetical protein